jgi:diaminopimelate decarboxylase
MSEGPLRVAIVGQGPKGTFALERLLHRAASLGASVRVEVDLYEPHFTVGAGPVYDPGQPQYLRMNFPAGRIDMWLSHNATVPASRRLTFGEWAREKGESVEDEDYPPRALVGRYLADGHEAIVRHAPPQADVALHRARVDEIRRRGRHWEVRAGGGTRGYEEVLLATGHEASSPQSLELTWDHAAPLIPAVYPVQARLSRAALASGSTVAVRGFGLSFIDAALALTEGRGGSFKQAGHPHRLRYLAGEGDAARILPFSRTGRPMLPKPAAGMSLPSAESERIATTGRARILALDPCFNFEIDLLDTIADTALASLTLTRRGGPAQDVCGEERRSTRRLLEEALSGLEGVGGVDVVGELERGLETGAGLRAPDTTWALGHAWRALYPALVERLGGEGLARSEWPRFHRLAREMERLAFGPSPLNSAKLLALIDAGRVDLSHVAGGRLLSEGGRTRLESASVSCEVDSVVDAVLPGPGAAGMPGGVLARLVQDGHARIPFARRGLEVRADGGCIGSDGTLSYGLSAIGRPTEDSVIGNDTLDRTLHSLAERWAERVIDRCTETGSTSEHDRVLSGAGV